MNPQLHDDAAARTSSAASTQSVLFVDLDGTLVRTDLLYETLMCAIKRNPWIVFLLPVWLLRGRAYLKRRLAEAGPVRVDLLPYDPEVLDRIAAARAGTRRVVLATATDALIAERVAAHLGIFDGVIASDGTTNLKSRRKLSAIRAWSDAPFDYVGDSAADVPIWLASSRAIAVRTHARILKRVIGAGPQVETIGGKGRGLSAAFRALRPHQWAKNALIFLPLLASHLYFDLSLWARDAIAFAAFCLCASSVYILNDLLDLESDRRHPRKRRRPFAAGELPIRFGLAAVIVLLLASFGLAILGGIPVLIVLAIYFALTLSYSLTLKALVLVDTIVLAGLYTMRVIAGYAATQIVPTFWLLAFALFLFFGLAMLKRFSELVDVRKRNAEGPPGRGYRADDLDVVGVFGAVTSGLAVLILALYINTADVTRLYAHPEILWGIVPVLLYWISKIWLIAHRGEMHEDPVVYALTDRESLTVFGICVGIAAVATL
jgi:4-hydroxybenzoate polyprenyltransferase/phosphoserine phosphatase